MMCRRPLPTIAVLLFAAGCSNGATSSTPPVAVANIASQAKLQFAVGTATIGSANGTIVGTNVVATFRGANGLSATLSNTPTLTGPPGFVIGFPGSLNTVSGLAPNVLTQYVKDYVAKQGFAPNYGAGLGPFVGVFGYGLAADNLLSANVATQLAAIQQAGQTCPALADALGNYTQSPVGLTGAGNRLLPVTSQAQSQELSIPIGINYIGNANLVGCPTSPIEQATANADIPINYYGGPPAWPSSQGYGTPAFFNGFPLGFTDVATPPVSGTYTLDVAYATNQDNTAYAHIDATATLTSTTALAPLTISTATVNADGTGTVSVNVPPGVFEAIVLVRTFDCRAGVLSGAKQNYSIVTHATGPQNIDFPANLGPPDASGKPTATFCAPAGNLGAVAFAAAFDYPAYESSYPFDLTQTPKITNGDGHTGQADVTTSAPVPMTPGR